MKTYLFTQNESKFLMTEDAWNKHLNMVRINLLQEETEDLVNDIVNDYKESFQMKLLSEDLVKFYEKEYGIKVNQSRKIESLFGELIHF